MLLKWSTTAEIDNAGFRVLRARKGEAPVLLKLIPSQGTELAGAEYEYLDTETTRATGVYYHLEDVDRRGRSSRHGPATIERVRRDRWGSGDTGG